MTQTGTPQTPPQPQGQQTSGLDPAIASLLCYVCTFITGIIFLVIEKQDKEVRFHAWQALLLGLAAFVIQIALSILSLILGAIAGFFSVIMSLLSPIVGLTFLIFWIICMIKAYQREHYKLPILGDLAEKQLAKNIL